MTQASLVLNAGSSSIKYALYDVAATGARLTKGVIDRIGQGPEHHADGVHSPLPLPDTATHAAILGWLATDIKVRFQNLTIIAAGHRVVHGGRDFDGPVKITDTVFENLDVLSPLAPGHQPHNLDGISAIRKIWPNIPQVACFDTAFHRSQPRIAQMFAIPKNLTDEGVLRYGFHGLSYDYIASQLPQYLGDTAQGRVIVLHLGHGASICAMHDRKSVATTMGFTALDGLVMGKRCGTIDPGVIFHLMREKSLTASQVETLLSSKSGLLGVSGESDDMRDLLDSTTCAGKEAVDLFVYRANGQIGTMAAALGGVDAIVFTGGMGENAALIRARILEGAQWLGVHADFTANNRHGPCLTTPDSPTAAWVIPTDEEAVIARQLRAVLNL